jgi:Tfp pilus assembly protein PilF
MLGEAFLAIQEPGKAVRSFEAALELHPKDADLAQKCAQAFVAAHEYHKAVDYYNRYHGSRLLWSSTCLPVIVLCQVLARLN